MDMRANDRAWLELKLESLAKTPDGEGFMMAFRRTASKADAGHRRRRGAGAQFRVEQIGGFKQEGPTPGAGRLFSPKGRRPAPTARCPGRSTSSTRRPAKTSCSASKKSPCRTASPPLLGGLSGNHPRALDGLTKLLSLDMRVVDPAWIGMKLRKLLDYPEPLGDFAQPSCPGTRKQANYPSTVAYLAHLIIHRYAMLGLLDENGFPVQQMGILQAPEEPSTASAKLCSECGNHTVIRKDGCDFCTACGAVGTCG